MAYPHRPLSLPIVLSLLLSSCTALPGRKAQENAARNEWGDCVMAAVMKLDDGHSDPASIAYGVAPVCEPQYVTFSQEMVAGMIMPEAKDDMRHRMATNEIKLITSAVLIYRSSKHPKAQDR